MLELNHNDIGIDIAAAKQLFETIAYIKLTNNGVYKFDIQKKIRDIDFESYKGLISYQEVVELANKYSTDLILKHNS